MTIQAQQTLFVVVKCNVEGCTSIKRLFEFDIGDNTARYPSEKEEPRNNEVINNFGQIAKASNILNCDTDGWVTLERQQHICPTCAKRIVNNVNKRVVDKEE